MEKIKVVGWTNFECDYPSKQYSKEEISQVFRAIQDDIYENDYCFSGAEHQNCATGVPVLSDGSCFRASMRAWGYLMAAVQSAMTGEKLSYMDFYMTLSESVLPPEKDIDVPPCEVDQQTVGCTVSADQEMVIQSVQLGMPFITTDKVLQRLYDLMSQNNKD